MRRFGIHGVVALAGLVACGRFGSANDDTPEPPTPSTPIGTNPDAGTVAPTDAGAESAAAGPRFCEQHIGARFCADFEAGEPTGADPPKDTVKEFSHLLATAPGGRHALLLTAKDVTTSWGFGDATYVVPLDNTFSKARLDLEVMCATSDFDFTRFAGFVFIKDTQRHLGFNIFGHDGELSFDAEASTLVPGKDGAWEHLTIELARSGDGKTLNATNVTVSGVSMGTGPKLDVKEKDGSLFFGFGLWDISATNTRDVVLWLDDVLLTLEK